MMNLLACSAVLSTIQNMSYEIQLNLHVEVSHCLAVLYIGSETQVSLTNDECL